VYVVPRQVSGFNLLDDIDLPRFRPSGAIEQWFNEFGESGYDAE
jgi:hypothetical protein